MKAPTVVKAACAKCPFRSDVPMYLRDDRRREIVQALVDGLNFNCHEYVQHGEDDDGEAFVSSVGPICAGALKALDRTGGSLQLARVEERLGMRNPEDYQRGPEVWDLDVWPLVPMDETADTWDPDDVEVETCSTVNAGCLAPAGFLGAGGGVIRGTVAADGTCATCEEPLCSNCADVDGNCLMCSEHDDDWEDDDA